MVSLFDSLATLAIHLELSICIICKSSCSLPRKCSTFFLKVASLWVRMRVRCKCLEVWLSFSSECRCFHACTMHVHRKCGATMYDANIQQAKNKQQQQQQHEQPTLPSDVIISFLLITRLLNCAYASFSCPNRVDSPRMHRNCN